jgi:hypothetical protein
LVPLLYWVETLVVYQAYLAAELVVLVVVVVDHPYQLKHLPRHDIHPEKVFPSLFVVALLQLREDLFVVFVEPHFLQDLAQLKVHHLGRASFCIVLF